jgi:NADH dehydrogenase
MIINRICILGGSGFVGQTLANRLTRDRYQLKMLTRRREKHKENLILLPTLDLVQADVHDLDQLKENFSGCDAVINLIGILNERGRKGQGFYKTHVELTQKLIDACLETGIKRILHMSALNADAKSGPSHYLKTKGQAEDLVHAAAKLGIKVTSFRPSVIFGHNDSFFNRFAKLLKMTPIFFPLACPHAKFSPVYVEDVAEAFARTINEPDCYGQRYDLCGPHVYSLQALVKYTIKQLDIHREIIPLNDIISRIQAAVFDFVPGKPFSTDNYLSTRVDSVSYNNGLDQLGITPTALEAVVPQYLSNQFQRARYDLFRSESRRVKSV